MHLRAVHFTGQFSNNPKEINVLLNTILFLHNSSDEIKVAFSEEVLHIILLTPNLEYQNHHRVFRTEIRILFVQYILILNI
jgi:hypothetical protein